MISLFFYYTMDDVFLKFWQCTKDKKSSGTCSQVYASPHCDVLGPCKLSRVQLGGILPGELGPAAADYDHSKGACFPAIVLFCPALCGVK